jgi:RHS repeat-associated protein
MGQSSTTETGLDYFGARYFSAAQGRFTSPDPILSSGRPDNPQTWNRYAYVLNNPLRYTDPVGLYEWEKNCKDNDQACQGNRQKFRDALAQLQKAAQNYAEGSDERNQIDAVIAKIGTEGDGNKIRIGFDAKMTDFGVTGPQLKAGFIPTGNILMKFNFGALDQTLSKWDAGTVSTAEAALVGHEGEHAVNGSLIGGLKYLLSGPERVRQEIPSFNIESLVFKSFNQLEPLGYGMGYPLWNPSWTKVDTATKADELRRANVQKVTEMLYGGKKQ